MEKLLIITPHMSTGGCPQFVLKKIELLKDFYDIYCIEYNFLSPHFVVQRDKVIQILGDKFLSLYDNKSLIIDFIQNINPDILFIEEFSETFIDYEFCKLIYKDDRKYKILECTHGSENKSHIKRHLPDRFIFVSEWSKKTYEHFNVPIDVIEYPIDKKEKNLNFRKSLNFEEDYKHILNVGLFTPGKNQKYVFEIAKELINEKIKFHFVGNQADNFKEYWQPLIENSTSNCVIWGEKDNVDEFLMSSDLFLFTSLFELNPLVIKESLCYDIPILMFNLETYCETYNNENNITFLSGNITEDVKKIKNILGI